MAVALEVYKHRTNIVPVSMGFDVSSETITSQIRVDPDEDSLLIAEWTVEFVSDGTDGELTLTLTQTDLADVTQTRGWMDMKRDSGGLWFPVFSKPLEVFFQGVVTE